MKPLSQLILPEIRDLIQAGDLDDLQEALQNLHPADIADLVEDLDEDSATTLFTAAPMELRVHIFEHLEDEQQERILDLIGAKAMIPVLEDMASDDRADLIQSLPPLLGEALVKELSQAEQRDVAKLVQYPEKTAGAIMTTEFAAVPSDVTVQQALAHLRRVAPHRETIYYVYVTDAQLHLEGVLSLRDLVFAEPSETVRAIVGTQVISLPVETSQEDVANELARYDFLAMPIVDAESRILGIVTHDDVIDVFEEEATEDTQRMGAVTPLNESYLQTSFWNIVRKRGLWVAVLFVAVMFTGTALRHYETTFEAVAALVIFIPLIMSAGGNVGSQSSALIIRAMAVGELELRDWARVMWREVRTGLVLGAVLGVMGVVRAALWGTGGRIALVVGLTFVGVVLWGAVVGSLFPLGLRRIGLDPATASSPFVASLVDVMGIVVYFNIARILLF